MRVEVPEVIFALPPGRLMAMARDAQVVLFLREDEWGMKKYPQRCPADLRIGTWDVDDVLLVVLLLRLMRTDLTTFEYWINICESSGVRLLQDLSAQAQIAAQVVTDCTVRSLRMMNTLRAGAAALVETAGRRNAWSPEEFARVRDRIWQLHPTAGALWWNCQPAG